MYSLKQPTGLRQRIAYLGGFERIFRLSLLRDGYRYVARNVSSVFYLVCFEEKPEFNNGVFLKTNETQHCEHIQGEVFLFMNEGYLLDLKTMEIEKYLEC